MRPRGVLTALVTPMHSDGRVDLDCLARLVERQLEAGISGLVPCGTTGETPTLSQQEQFEIISKVVEVSGGSLPIYAGAGANSTEKACQLVKAAADAGATGTLQVSPYYNKPTQSGLLAHFRAVADASALPVMLYNIPGRTAVRIEPETVAKLAEHPHIVAIKEATGDLALASRIMQLAPGLDVLSGDDALALPLIALGATGVVSVAANVAPAQMVDLVAAAMAGDMAAAREQHHRLFPLFQALFIETNPIPIKAVMAELALIPGGLRLPLEPAKESTVLALGRAMGTLEQAPAR